MDEFKPFPSMRFLWIYLSVVWLVLLIVRMSAPSDLMDNDQERPAAYVLDCIQNGNWASQRDATGDVMSKPPFYTWLGAILTWLFRGPSLWALYLPGAIAVLLTVWLIFAFGSVFFGRDAGFLGALAYLLATTTYKQLALARTDPVLTFLVFLMALLVFHAWQSRKGWFWFWLVAALGTLTKGPLVLIFALGGLWAVLWERRSRKNATLPASGNEDAGGKASILPAQLIGLLVFGVITGLWFWMAWLEDGQDFIDKVIIKELFGHAVDSADKTDWYAFAQPLAWFLSRFAPWSLATCAAIWLLIKKPSNEGGVRCFERFLTAYLIFGFLILSVGSHKRADLMFPLLPAAGLLAGRFLAHFMALGERRILPAISAVTLLFIVGLGAYSHIIRARDEKVILTQEAIALAEDIEEKVGSAFPLTHLDTPYAIQFFLRTMRPQISFDQARELLTGEAAAFVFVKKAWRFQDRTGLQIADLHVLEKRLESEEEPWHIVSNHPRLEYAPHVATILHGLRVDLYDAKILRAYEEDFIVELTQPAGEIAFRNISKETRRFQLTIRNDGDTKKQKIILAPGEETRMGS
ncbi:MAG: ArnT family glycosyltransferase [Candidatus Sumerlaeia bacterium]